MTDIDADLPNVAQASFDLPSWTSLEQHAAPDHPPRILLLYGSLRERSYSRLATLRISLSSVRSAIAVRSRAFSVSSSFRRFTWSDFNPPNSCRQR